MSKYQTIMGIDVGLSGGISILDGRKAPIIQKMPVKKIVVNKKPKNTYDMTKIVGIFKEYKDKKVLFCIEKQGVRPKERAVASMTAGKGFGQLLGMACALDFNIVEVTPQAWKKQFPELITDEMMVIKAEMKELRLFGKTLEDKDLKKENDKYIEKLGRNFKSLAKTEARKLVSIKYPAIADKFQKKNTDGMAESLLIALYGRENQNGLV